MATKAQKVRLSIFLIISSSVLLLFFIILVGNRLLKRMDIYYIVYEDISVTGLEPGAAVKFRGVQVGRVSGLAVKDAASIIIEIEVEQDTPIKKDTEAILTLVGITGLKFIELTGGSVESESLPVGSNITAGQSLFENISGYAEIILGKLERVLNNINLMTGPETAGAINDAIHSLASISSEIDTLLRDNRPTLELVIDNLASTTEKVDSTMTVINNMIQSEKIQNAVSNIDHITETLRTQIDSLRLAETSRDLLDLLENTNKMVVNYDLLAIRARDDILGSLRNLDETLDNLREAADVIRENPSVLIRGRTTTGDRLE